MRICLLTNQDLDATPFPDDDWPCDPRPFLPEAHWEYVTLEKESAIECVSNLCGAGFDLFFNLCDGAADEDSPGIEVVQTLEARGVPFTGATSQFYEPSRTAMKEACLREGIPTPAYAVVRNQAEIDEAAERLTYPMFVKHYSSYASVGLTRASRVQSKAGLQRQASKMIKRYGGALIEEYIPGIECTVLVAENPQDPEQPITYLPMQYRFPEGESFKHANMKWVDYDALSSFPVEDEELKQRLEQVSARFFVALDGASFGRCDLRVDADGTPYMLEINPNCGVYYPATDPGSADLCLTHDPAGHRGFTRLLVDAAFARNRRAQGAEPAPNPTLSAEESSGLQGSPSA